MIFITVFTSEFRVHFNLKSDQENERGRMERKGTENNKEKERDGHATNGKERTIKELKGKERSSTT